MGNFVVSTHTVPNYEFINQIMGVSTNERIYLRVIMVCMARTAVHNPFAVRIVQ